MKGNILYIYLDMPSVWQEVNICKYIGELSRIIWSYPAETRWNHKRRIIQTLLLFSEAVWPDDQELMCIMKTQAGFFILQLLMSAVTEEHRCYKRRMAVTLVPEPSDRLLLCWSCLHCCCCRCCWPRRRCPATLPPSSR